MKIGKLFHLTMLVDEFEGPEQFFNATFSPMCTMRGYAEHWHRHAAIYVFADTVFEPMHVLPPREGEEGTSWFRFMDRYGPRVHNMAYYVDDPDALDERLQAAGIRTTRAGTGDTVFAHPKDTPGMLEFFPTPTLGTGLPDPRFTPTWDAFRRDYWPNLALGLERLSHVTILVRDLDKASAFYTDVLDAQPLSETNPTIAGADSRYVLVGEDTVVELTHPPADSPYAKELDEIGEGAVSATFQVRDVEAAGRFLTNAEAPVATADADAVVLDRKRTWGLEFRFTGQTLAGDPRT